MSEILERDQQATELVTVPKKEIDLSYLNQLAVSIDSQSRDYTYDDFVAESNPLIVQHGEFLGMNFDHDSIPSNRMGFTPHSFRQLCVKLGVPARYIQKCFDNGKVDLSLDNMNRWLSTYKGSMFVRTHQDDVRGFLSSRYSVMDTHEILDVLENVLDEDEYSIKGYYLSPERFHLRMVNREMMKLPDDLFAGIQIDSSDVGRSVLKVSFLIFKQVCTNGLIVKKAGGELFHQRHVGISAEEFLQELTVSIKRIPEVEKHTINLINDLMDTKLPKFDEKGIERISNRLKPLNFKPETVEEVLSILKDRYEPTEWGLINAITDHSKIYTLERRLEIEEFAGKLLVA